MFKISTLFILLFVGIQWHVSAQDYTKTHKDVDVSAIPLGGMDRFCKLLKKEVKYPNKAKKKKADGSVHVFFVVETDGKISNVGVLLFSKNGFDRQAIKVVKKQSPVWRAAEKDGKSVRQLMKIKFDFMYQDGATEVEVTHIPHKAEKDEDVAAKLPSKAAQLGTINAADGDTHIFKMVDEMPAPKGGMSELYKYISANMTYPEQAQELGVEGKVYLSFMVETDGSLSEIKIMRGIGAGCDEEAVRVLKASPNWIPGKFKGKPVRTKMVLPIVFRFTNDDDKK